MLRWSARRLKRPLRAPVVARRHRDFNRADVALASYPRSGSNWLALMLGELLVGHEVDFETDPPPIPFIGGQSRVAPNLPGGGRLIKTHERWRREYLNGIYL